MAIDQILVFMNTGGLTDEEPAVIEGPPELSAVDKTRTEQPWRWHAIQASGVVLAVLIPLHFIVTFVRTDIARTTALTMTERWENSSWRAIELIVIALALIHGSLGLHKAIVATIRSAVVRLIASSIIVLVSATALVLASIVVINYR